MADQKLTDKTSLTEYATNDLIHVIDVSDTSSSPQGTSKKSTIDLLKDYLSSEILQDKFLQTSFDIVNPVISGGTTGKITLLPTLPSGYAYIVQSINTFTVVPVVGTGGGNPELNIYYNGDGGTLLSGIPFLISGSGNNTVWNGSSSTNRYIDIDTRAIEYSITHGTDQTFTGTVRVFLKYSIVSITP